MALARRMAVSGLMMCLFDVGEWRTVDGMRLGEVSPWRDWPRNVVRRGMAR